MPFEYKESSSESSSNEKLLEAKAFLENLGEDYEISKISHVTHRHVDMIVGGRRIWVLLENLQPDAGFEFLVDDQDLTSQEEYRSKALGLLERAQQITDEQTRERHAAAVDFLDTLPESYEIENISIFSGRAANCTINGHRIEVNFVDGFEEENDFEFSVDAVDFTGDKKYRTFALDLLEKAQQIKNQEKGDEYVKIKNFLDTLPKSYEVENENILSGFAASGSIGGHKIFVNFPDGDIEGGDFEFSVDTSDLTNNEECRTFALNFVRRVQANRKTFTE